MFDLLESLESRRLMSITTATLAGPLTAGSEDMYETLAAGIKVGTLTTRIVGPTTVGSTPVTKIEAVQTVGSNHATTDQYVAASGDDGFIAYKGTANATYNGTTTTATSKYSPSKINYPPTMTARRTYSYDWDEVATTSINGAAATTSHISTHYTIKLESETPTTVNTSAGTFSAYKIVTTTSTTTGSGSPTTATESIWAVPGIGTVKFTTSQYTEVLQTYSGSGMSQPLAYSSDPNPMTIAPPTSHLDNLIV